MADLPSRERISEALTRVHRALIRVNAGLDPVATVAAIVDGVVDELGWPAAELHMLQPDGLPGKVIRSAAGRAAVPLLGGGNARAVWEEVQGISAGAGELDRARLATGSGWLAPLRSSTGALLAALLVATPDGVPVPADEIELLRVFVAQAALALDNARLHADVLAREAERSGLLERMAAVVEAAPSAIVEVDAAGRVLLWNRTAEQIFGWSAPEVVGGANPVVPEGFQPAYRERLATVFRGGEVPVMQLSCLRRDGSWVEVEVFLTPIHNGHGSAGQVQSCLTMITDITQRKVLERRLRHAAQHDPLTGLANRRLFQERLHQAHSRARRRGTRLAVLLADLDGFKQVNDRHGHAVGDLVLTQAADRLRDVVRPEDVVARLGGDEFVVLLEDVESDAHAHQVASRLTEAMVEPFALGPAPDQQPPRPGPPVIVGASVGVALSGGEGHPEGMLSQADAAMYAAKPDRRADRTVDDSESGGSGI